MACSEKRRDNIIYMLPLCTGALRGGRCFMFRYTYRNYIYFLILCHFLLQRQQVVADEAVLFRNMLKQQEEMQREQKDVGAMRYSMHRYA